VRLSSFWKARARQKPGKEILTGGYEAMFSKEALIKFAILVAAVVVGNIATTYVNGLMKKA